MRSGDPDASRLCEPAQAPGGRMAVHPGAAGVEEDRPAGGRADCRVDGAADGWRQWDQDDLGAFAAHPQYPVAMLFTQVEMPAPVASKIRRPRSPAWPRARVAVAAGLAGGGEQSLELQVGESEGW